MFGFWKKKESAEILSDIETRLANKDDYQKILFLQKKLPIIRTALEDDPLPLPCLRSGHKVTEIQEKAHGYLHWHSKILDTLHDEDEFWINPNKLSPAAHYFIENTRHDVVAFFHHVFLSNPVIAIQSLGPAELFEKEIFDAMVSLSRDEDPHLYFDCYDEMDVDGESDFFIRFEQKLADATVAALQNMLMRDPNALLFPHLDQNSQSTTYLDYLPDGIMREKFITTHQKTIDAAFDAAPHKGSDGYRQDRNIILKERVKICFHAAASGDTDSVHENMASLETEPCDHVFVYSHYVGLPYLRGDRVLAPEPFNPDPFTPQFELIRLSNPSAPEDATDEDRGASSKYLWMIKRDGIILASTFSKASMADYLAEQNKFGSITCPTTTDWEGFLYEKTAPPNTDYHFV